jgi:hypothetical protein
MSDNNHPCLDNLNSTNYMVWSTRMEDHLVGKYLLDVITHGFMADTPSVDAIRVDRKAFSLLRTYVSDALIHFLTGDMCASQAWTTLTDLHMSNSHNPRPNQGGGSAPNRSLRNSKRIHRLSQGSSTLAAHGTGADHRDLDRHGDPWWPTKRIPDDSHRFGVGGRNANCQQHPTQAVQHGADHPRCTRPYPGGNGNDGRNEYCDL